MLSFFAVRYIWPKDQPMAERIKLYRCGIATVSRVGKPPKPPKQGEKREIFYRLKWKNYRLIASSLATMWEKKTNMLNFYTLTMDKKLHESVTNYCLSRFLENLSKNYGLVAYLWTMEFQPISGNVHYHCVFDMPFIPLQDNRSSPYTGKYYAKGLNTVWCETVNRGLYDYWLKEMGSPKTQFKKDYAQKRVKEMNVLQNNKHAVGLPKKQKGKRYRAEITSLEGLTRYLCKYMSKGIKEGAKYRAKCYGMSQNIVTKPIEITLEDLQYILEGSGVHSRFTKEYFDLICIDKKDILSMYFSQKAENETVETPSGLKPDKKPLSRLESEKIVNLKHQKHEDSVCVDFESIG